MAKSLRSRFRALISQAIDIALVPVRPLISKSAQKIYLGTALFSATSFFLLSIASVAFWLFYYEYVPTPGVERIVHLQFGDGHPHGTTVFADALAPDQAYDIALLLHLPRTPSNLQAGNFMLSLFLLPYITGTTFTQRLLPSALQPDNNTIAHSRRPAILTYTSSVVSTASTLTHLPLYVFGLSQESETLTIPMFEGAVFTKGTGNVPKAATAVVEADEKMQFYDMTIRIIAKLSGLRWVLYNHRLLSFVLFTGAFWASSMISMGIVWLGLTFYMSASPRGKGEEGDGGVMVKRESTSEPDLSDASRSFPTLGKQKPLKYEAQGMKQEEETLEETALQPLQAMAAEADDEEDFEIGAGSAFRDSGIGTGRESRGEGVRRRQKGESSKGREF